VFYYVFRQLVNMMINTDGDFIHPLFAIREVEKNEQQVQILSDNFDK
jgi:hypothetical protein